MQVTSHFPFSEVLLFIFDSGLRDISPWPIGHQVEGGGGGDQNKIRALQQNVYESEKRAMSYMKRNNKVQADYHNLIGITAELVDALESTVQGNPVSTWNIDHLFYIIAMYLIFLWIFVYHRYVPDSNIAHIKFIGKL